MEEPEKGVKDIKVLVVEDMALNQLLMKTLLEDYGFDHDMAANGLVAIEKLREKEYDIILMDLQMPEMNGFEATEYIRNTLKSKIPIIALTADVTTVDLAKCRAVGMNDYIAKPVDDRVLYAKMIALVKKPAVAIAENPELIELQVAKEIRCIDLDYLNRRTKSNPKLMLEMIGLYLEQTPPLILTIKQSWTDKNWVMLNSAIHKIIPSFLIMGISADYEVMAKKIQEFAISQTQTEGINEMVLEIERICTQACLELEEEIKNIKKNHK
jgi:CheY-like chemotaxis protein